VQKTPEGGAPGGHNPPGRATPPWRTMVGGGPHQGPLTYSFSPLLHLPPEKNLLCLLSRVLAPEPEIFNLFARSSVSETVLEDCYLVCDSSIGPISFSSSGLYCEYLAILGAAVDELACRILRFFK
jgi:hypothetical protein